MVTQFRSWTLFLQGCQNGFPLHIQRISHRGQESELAGAAKWETQNFQVLQRSDGLLDLIWAWVILSCRQNLKTFCATIAGSKLTLSPRSMPTLAYSRSSSKDNSIAFHIQSHKSMSDDYFGRWMFHGRRSKYNDLSINFNDILKILRKGNYPSVTLTRRELFGNAVW